MFNKTGCGSACGSSFRLRPVAFGLALGITAMLMIFLTPLGEGIAAATIQADMWRLGLFTAGVSFAKGFIFGLVSAIFYNLFLCCSHHCCKKTIVNDSCNITDKTL